MGVKEQLSGALGGALGYGLDVINDALVKATTPRDIDNRQPMTVADAKPQKLPPDPATDEPTGLLFDPFALIDQLGYRDRPSGLTYQTLREMAKRVPTYTAIEQVRINQICAFAAPQEDERDPGFAIELRDPKKTAGRTDIRRMNELTDWTLQTGSAWGPTRDDFRTFLHKLSRDSLELDQGTFEVNTNRKGIPAEFVCLDGATMRLADVPPGAEHHPDPKTIKFVQVYDEIIIAEFPIDSLCWGIRNPRSDIRANGYGYSELEMLLNVITASLWAFEYNKRFFCASGDSLIPTRRGLETLGDLVGQTFETWTGTGWSEARAVETGLRPLVRIKLWNGLELKTSPEHRYRVIPREGREAVWREQCALKPKDFVLLGYARIDAPMDPGLFLVDETYQSCRSWGRPWTATAEVIKDPEFWEMMGFALGDGYFPPRRIRDPGWIRIFPHYEKDHDLFERFLACADRHGISAKKIEANGYPAIEIQHVEFVRWLYEIGFCPSSEGKRIPSTLFMAPAWIREAVLRGLFSADGHTRQHEIGCRYRTPTVQVTDSRFRQSVLQTLWSVGVAANDIGEGWERKGEINVQDIAAFERVGYLQKYKNEGIERAESSKDRWDQLHPLFCEFWATEVKQSPRWLSLSEKDRAMIGLAVSGKSRVSRPRMQSIMSQVGITVPEEMNYCQVPVDVLDLDPVAEERMFDLEVFDDRHLFLANFMGVHNSQGTAAKGIVNLKGGVPDSKLDAFRRMWQMMIAGVGNAHKTPMVSVDEVQWIDLHKSNTDMEYSAWMDWLIKITCAVMLMDPAELNFNYGNTGQASQMFQAPAEQKLTQSKDRGLRPLLTYFAKWINTHLIWRLDPNYRLVFKGLNAKSEDDKVELASKKSKYLMTVDELRAEEDLTPMKDGLGEVILDPTWLQNKQAKEMAAQQEAMGVEGEPGAEPAPPPGMPGIDDQEGEEEEPGDFEQIFNQGGEGEEKSLSAGEQLRATRQRLETGQLLEDDPLQKARVTVYEIDL